MTRKGLCRILTVAVALLAAVALRADLGPLQVDWGSSVYSRNVTYTTFTPSTTAHGGSNVNLSYTDAAGTIHGPAPAAQYTAPAASMTAVIEAPPTSLTIGSYVPLNVALEVFCLDLGAYVNTGDDTSYYLSELWSAPHPETGGTNGYPMGATRAAWMGLLAAQYWQSGNWDADPELDGSYLDLSAQSDRHAAFQVAVWEILYESPDDGVTTTSDAQEIPRNLAGRVDWDAAAGDFSIASGTVATLANTWLTWAENLVYNTYGGNVFLAPQPTNGIAALVSPAGTSTTNRQDLLVLTTRQVPEPSGLVLAGLGLVGFLLRRKARA